MRMYIQWKVWLVIAMRVRFYIRNLKDLIPHAPLQLGAELFGSDSIDADVEMVDLMISLIQEAGLADGIHLDLGHVGLFRSLIAQAGLSKATERQLSDLYQRKALPELAEFTANLKFGSDFYTLGRFASDLDALKRI